MPAVSQEDLERLLEEAKLEFDNEFECYLAAVILDAADELRDQSHYHTCAAIRLESCVGNEIEASVQYNQALLYATYANHLEQVLAITTIALFQTILSWTGDSELRTQANFVLSEVMARIFEGMDGNLEADLECCSNIVDQMIRVGLEFDERRARLVATNQSIKQHTADEKAANRALGPLFVDEIEFALCQITISAATCLRQASNQRCELAEHCERRDELDTPSHFRIQAGRILQIALELERIATIILTLYRANQYLSNQAQAAAEEHLLVGEALDDLIKSLSFLDRAHRETAEIKLAKLVKFYQLRRKYRDSKKLQ